MSVSIDNEKCEGCGICVPLCPVQAISILNGKAYIDQNRCTECLQCINACAKDAIQRVSDREISLKTRESPIPISEERSIPHRRQIISGNKQNTQLGEKIGFFLDEFKNAIHNFFQANSSFSMSGRNERGKYGKRRRRRRGGRY
jgi:Fe-S-cluster-containing hydrogenase component 2